MTFIDDLCSILLLPQSDLARFQNENFVMAMRGSLLATLADECQGLLSGRSAERQRAKATAKAAAKAKAKAKANAKAKAKAKSAPKAKAAPKSRAKAKGKASA